MGPGLEWRVDPWNSRTVRWLLYGQVALVDGGAILAGLVGLFVLTASLPHALGGLALIVLLLVIVRWVSVSPVSRWRADGAVSRLATGHVLTALLAGVVVSLVAYSLVGVVALFGWLVAFVGLGLAVSLVDDGVATGQIDAGAGTVSYAGRDRPLASITDVSRLRVGDVIVLRLHGVKGLDEPELLVVHESDEERIADALSRVAAGSDADPGQAQTDISWQQLQAPRLAAYALLVVTGSAVAGGVAWVGGPVAVGGSLVGLVACLALIWRRRPTGGRQDVDAQ